MAGENISPKLGIGLDSGISSGVSSGSGVAVSLGTGGICGAGTILGKLRSGGPGLIGRTGSKYWVRGGDAAWMVSVGSGVSPYDGIGDAPSSDGDGVSDEIGVGVGDGELLL